MSKVEAMEAVVEKVEMKGEEHMEEMEEVMEEETGEEEMEEVMEEEAREAEKAEKEIGVVMAKEVVKEAKLYCILSTHS